jgi:hypothetical protein
MPITLFIAKQGSDASSRWSQIMWLNALSSRGGDGLNKGGEAAISEQRRAPLAESVRRRRPQQRQFFVGAVAFRQLTP